MSELDDLTTDDWDKMSAGQKIQLMNEECSNNKHEGAADILKQAVFEMEDRAAIYDNEAGERSIGKTVEAFQIITGGTEMRSEEHGWLFMEVLKLVRSQQGQFKLDNYVDASAYAGLMGEAAMRERG